MKFGIFDQNDRGGLPLAQQYEERMQLAELYDRSGFHCYHISEHHSTPLSTTPAQSVFLAALSQRTRHLRLCPLVYLLPIHHPMRLAEEICMLDHLSKGRFDFGVGRGASPHELEALGVDPAQAAKMYAEAFEILKRYFAADVLDYAGTYWQFNDVPVVLKPLQQPHPPIWYALASAESAVWPALNGVNVVCGGPVERVRSITDRYRQEWSKAHPSETAEPLMGVNRYIIVAETDDEAVQLGRNAWPVFYENFYKLWRKHGTQPVNAKLPPDFDAVLAMGHAVAGSPETVTRLLASQVGEGGLNYLIGSFMFGNLAHQDAVSSIERFAGQVMPALKDFHRAMA